MPIPEQKNRADAFRAMHTGAGPVLLANVWDVASARIVEDGGFSAVGTTSAGIAFAHGFPDGQKISREQMFAVIARIAGAVNVPVTADVEAGYGETAERAAQTARQVIEAGAVGMNFEDATGDAGHPLTELALQVERIRAIRESAAKLGVPLVLNARTDVYLLQVGEPGGRYDEAMRRLAAYRDAGADCVFVPGLRDLSAIKRIVADLGCPVNILGVPGSPSVNELVDAGVKRISLGSGPMRAAMGLLRRVAEELKTAGTYHQMESAPTHAEMNQLMNGGTNPRT
ncbi:MAG TPA: isocitrate lyase/phosphoenolpyruvate mutase family protein [Dongiaceae bacterium]|nr:isocitrate lyase/phosphoenolpyruvate mutase family protein [Dongiaceae bacterium]